MGEEDGKWIGEWVYENGVRGRCVREDRDGMTVVYDENGEKRVEEWEQYCSGCCPVKWIQRSISIPIPWLCMRLVRNARMESWNGMGSVLVLIGRVGISE